MPNTKSAERRMRNSARKNLQNSAVKSKLRRVEKQFRAAVTAGKKDEAAKLLPGVLEAADIIPLPAMNGDGDVGKLLECFSGVHAQGGIAFFGEAVGLFDLSIGAHVCRFKMLSDSQVCAMVAASLSRGNTRFCPVSAPPKQVAAALTLRQTGGACR